MKLNEKEYLEHYPEHLIPSTQEFPEIEKFIDDQMSIYWLPSEVKTEKDIHDVLTNFSEAERHGVLTTLKLFSLYETNVGDWWGNRFKRIFDNNEFHRMGSLFSMVELAIHEKFYRTINELLNLHTREFYLSFRDEPTFRERILKIGEWVNEDNDAIALAAFAFVEGVVLYSSFAFLKHFQSNGKNKLANLVRGIDFSLRDENIHAMASAWCFRYIVKDMPQEEKDELAAEIVEIAKVIYQQEDKIVDMIFEKGEIEGISTEDMKVFVRSRVNLMLDYLGLQPIFDAPVDKNPIASWFYKALQDWAYQDFFVSVGNQYNRAWDSTAFEWKYEGDE